MPTNTGYGTSVGNNFGGGGIIYVTNLNPTAGSAIEATDIITFTLAVEGGLVDLETIQITIAGEAGFDGSTATFGPRFSALSSYEYEASANGYSFAFKRTNGFAESNITIEIYAETTDGGTATHSYSLTTVPLAQYPLVPWGKALVDIDINRFSGESHAGLLGGADGQIFFSPGLENANPDVQLDVDDVELRTYASEHYEVKQTNNDRPFLWGPPYDPVPPSAPAFPPVVSTAYLPVLNDEGFGFLKTTGASVRGVLHDTILDEDTFILY